MSGTKNKIFCNNGEKTIVVYDLKDIPEGWNIGKANLQYKNLILEHVVAYYATHSIRNCAIHFNLTEKAFTKYLLLDNIELRSKEERYKLSQKHVEETNLKKYGCKSVLQLETTKQKSRETCLEKYGVEHIGQAKETKEKIKETNISKYGSPYLMQVNEFKDKAKDTCLIKYGVDNPMKSVEIKNKVIKTNIEKYGSAWQTETEHFKERSASTKLEKYGDKFYNNREKAAKTNTERYGVSAYGISGDYLHKCHHKYQFENEFFDSIPELAFWIYCVNNKIDIQRNYEIKFTYVFQDKQHYYIPDFCANEQFVEIKGDHFFKEDGTMCNPFNQDEDELYEAKHLCGLQNNVIFITSSTYNEYINYCKLLHGKSNWHKKYSLYKELKNIDE